MIYLGLIGYGRWGPNLARCVAADTGTELAVICDSDATRLAVASQAHPAASLANDWREVVSDPRLDAVVIATPAASHFELAHAALVRGKHVLIEKPIARSTKEASALIDAAAARRLIVMTDHTCLYGTALRMVAKLVRSGTLGAIRSYDSIRTNACTPDRDVDVLWDLAIHDLSILDFLFDAPPQAVAAQAVRHDRSGLPSAAVMTLRFANDMRASIRVDWFAQAKSRRIEIAGVTDRLVFDDLKPAAKIELTGSSGGGSHLNGFAALPEHEPLGIAIDHFASCVRARQTPLSDGAAGLRVVRLLEAAEQSMANGERFVALEAEEPRRLSARA